MCLNRLITLLKGSQSLSNRVRIVVNSTGCLCTLQQSADHNILLAVKEYSEIRLVYLKRSQH